MKRRDSLKILAGLPFICFNFDILSSESFSPENKKIFKRVVKAALKKGLDKKPIGETVGGIGLEFLGFPYEAKTLEGSGAERCRIHLSGLDCFTFVEASLCIARVIKKGKLNWSDFVAEVKRSRYRNGVVKDYASRLHYASDWIRGLFEKNFARNVTKELGGEVFPLNIYYMSRNPESYSALKRNPELIDKIKKIERQINETKHYYIPQNKIAAIESRLNTGDIVAFATNIPGLDYAHVGLIHADEKKRRKVLHASSKSGKVIIGKTVADYAKIRKDVLGITIARPVLAK